MKSFLVLPLLVISFVASAQIEFGDLIIPENSGYPRSIVVGDFDGNGREDVIVNTVPIADLKAFYSMSAAGQYYEIKKLDLVDGWRSSVHMSAADLDHDGKDDLVLVDQESKVSDNIRVCLSTGAGFSVKSFDTDYSSVPWTASIVDFDEDGKLDIIVATGGKAARFLKGDGQGNFTISSLPLSPTFAGNYFGFQVLDLNGDHQGDFVFTTTNKIKIYTKNGPGYIVSTKDVKGEVDGGLDHSLHNSVLADFNDDEIPDLVTLTRFKDTDDRYKSVVSFFASNGNGTFADAVEINIGEPLIQTGQMEVQGIDNADYDNDDHEDLVLAVGSANFDKEIVILHNMGGAVFEKNSPSTPYPRTSEDARFINLDGTGALEIVSTSGGRIMEWFRLVGDDWKTVDWTVYGGSCTNGTVYDIDNDGNMDIIGAAVSAPAIAIWYGMGNFQYEPPVFITVTGALMTVDVADFNKDGYGDVAYVAGFTVPTAPGPDYVSVLLSTGWRQFAGPAHISDVEQSYDIRCVDVDNDNDIDIIDEYSIHRNNGSGVFTHTSLSTISYNVNSTNVGHFNNDNFIDVAVISNGGVFIYLNDGSGGFPSYQQVELSVAVDKIRAVDFNNDNLTDIVGYSNVFDSDLNKNVMDIVFAKRSANGEFNESHLTPASSVWYIGAIDAADLDADGFADLVTASRESIGDGIRVYKGQASGVFTNTASEFFSTQIATPSGGQPQVISSIHLKDLNDDNKLDIASLYLDDITLVILPNDHVNGSIENPSNLQVNATETGATVALEKGNGNGRIILVREAGENLVAPSGEVFYSANVEYGKGDKIGASFVVMRDNNEGVSITGLKPNTSYVVTAFEYSSTLANTHIQYSSGGVSETFTTLEQQQPITAPSNLNVTATGNTATITLTKGSGSGRIILLRKANEDLTTPVNNVFYTPDAEYGKGSKVGASFVVMRNSSEGAVIIGLTPGVSYVVTAFEYLSDGANTYIEYSDGSVNKTFTTLEEPVDEPDDDEPITGPSNLNVNATETQATVTLTKGTGDGRIILIRKSGETLTIPNDNIFYAANTEYGKGDKIGASFVVMNADLESVVITALTPASSYVVSVFEYSSNASHTHVDYMGALITKTFVTSRDQVDDPGDDPNEEPITAPSNLNVSATETEAIVTLTKGTGDGRIILVRKSNESLTNPTDNMFYTANPAYGEGNKVGTSSVVMRSNNESVLVTGLAPITSYTVTVFEYVAGSNTIAYTNDGVSKTFTTLEDIVLAVEDVATKSFSVSPNPATSIVTIELPAGTIVSELAFYNSIGARFQLPAVHRSDAVEVNVSDLHPGLYVIKLAGTSLKLIKQ